MTEIVEPHSRSRRDLLELLVRLTAAVGREANQMTIRRALTRAEQDVPAGIESARLVYAARLLGVRLIAAYTGPKRVFERVDQGAPVVGWRSEGSPEWLLVLDRKANRMRLAALDGEPEDRWVGANELVSQLRIEWYFAELVSPIENSPHSGQRGHGHGAHGHQTTAPLARLWRMLWPEGRDIWLVVLFALGIGILSLATPLTVDTLITSVKGGIAMRAQVLVLALILLFCLGLAAFMRALSNYVVELIQQRFFVRVVAELSHRLPRVTVAAFDRQNGPALVNRFFEVLTVQKAGAVLLLDGISVIVQAAVGLVVLGFYHPFLLGFDLGLLAVVAFIVFVLGRGAVGTSIEESFAKYAVAGWMEEMVRHPRTFKDGHSQEYALERSDTLTRDYLMARQRHFRILFRQILFALGLQAVASAVLLGIGGWLVIPDESGRSALDVGQLVAAELIVVVIVGSIVKLGKSLESYYDLMAGVDKLGHLLDLPLERPTGEPHPKTGAAELRIRNLTYTYDDHGHGHPVISALDATIPAGARVALTGTSGSGKSTLAELIYGLRDPVQGVIELDGVDLRDIRLELLRDQVALVAALEIIDGTLIENIQMGRYWLSHAEVREALEKVGLLDDILRLPDGLNTRMTSAGNPLSLGQARRLLLARAILGKPRLLILDESVDELDETTRETVLNAVLAPSAPWTTLVITHREDVALRCDQRLHLGSHQPEEVS